MKSTGVGKKKSSSSSRSKNYYGYPNGGKNTAEYIQAARFVPKNKKEIGDLNLSAMSNYKGGKFLRGRKYSFSSTNKDK